MPEPAEWVILLTERIAEPGEARVFVYGRRRRDDADGPVTRLGWARVFHSRESAEAEVTRWREDQTGVHYKLGAYVKTVAPLRSPGIPALPGGAGMSREGP